MSASEATEGVLRASAEGALGGRTFFYAYPRSLRARVLLQLGGEVRGMPPYTALSQPTRSADTRAAHTRRLI